MVGKCVKNASRTISYKNMYKGQWSTDCVSCVRSWLGWSLLIGMCHVLIEWMKMHACLNHIYRSEREGEIRRDIIREIGGDSTSLVSVITKQRLVVNYFWCSWQDNEDHHYMFKELIGFICNFQNMTKYHSTAMSPFLLLTITNFVLIMQIVFPYKILGNLSSINLNIIKRKIDIWELLHWDLKKHVLYFKIQNVTVKRYWF